MVDAVYERSQILPEPVSITRLKKFHSSIDYDYTCCPRRSLGFPLTSLQGATQDSWKSAAREFCRALHVAAPTRIQTTYPFLQMEEENILVHRKVGELDAGKQAIPVECPKVALSLCCCSLNAASDLVSTE